MTRCRATSSATPSWPSATALAKALTPARMRRRSAVLRRAAASSATSASSARRTSTIWMTASCEAAWPFSRSSGSARWACTKTPLPWREATRPLDLRRDSASRTTVRLTPNCATNSSSVGRRSPGCICPCRMLASSAWATWSARELAALMGVKEIGMQGGGASYVARAPGLPAPQDGAHCTPALGLWLCPWRMV